MKGVIFNILEEFIVDGWGEPTFERVFSVCPQHQTDPYVGPGTYPDADLFKIVGAACRILELDPADALRAFGRYCAHALAERAPGFFEGHANARAFLQTVHDVVHVEVHKLYPGAITPHFTYSSAEGPDQLTIEYRSQRKLCLLMEGLLAGTGELFGEPVLFEQADCMHEGADHCRFALRFPAMLERAA